MQHTLQVSRKIDYGLRAMIYLASVPEGSVVPFREIAKAMEIPQDFLAKILKTLVDAGVVSSSRGVHGGYALGRPAREISFLEVIEAVEGPIQLNLCLSEGGKEACGLSPACTMYSVWKEGQERMVEVYRNARLDQLAMKSSQEAPLRSLRTPESPRPA
ncbi:MAG: RrF2 family transcriptional regulator [Deltaproteobacteria bacterium]